MNGPTDTPNMEQSLFGDMANLEKTLAEDHTGDRARGIVAYFRTICTSSENLLRQARDDNEQHMLRQLVEGFKASERIVCHVWETLHGNTLVM